MSSENCLLSSGSLPALWSCIHTSASQGSVWKASLCRCHEFSLWEPFPTLPWLRDLSLVLFYSQPMSKIVFHTLYPVFFFLLCLGCHINPPFLVNSVSSNSKGLSEFLLNSKKSMFSAWVNSPCTNLESAPPGRQKGRWWGLLHLFTFSLRSYVVQPIAKSGEKRKRKRRAVSFLFLGHTRIVILVPFTLSGLLGCPM